MWAGPAVGTLDPNKIHVSGARAVGGKCGVLVALAGPVHDLRFACALVRSTGGVSRKGDLVIPSQPGPEDDRTRSGLDQSGADADQTFSDGDQTSSDQDQGAADRDQLAADSDQAASDRDLAHGVDRDAYETRREARERPTETRRTTANERHNTASARDVTAHERDVSALARDHAAEARDLEDDGRDAEIAALTSLYGTKRRQAVGRSWMRAARGRQRAATDRARSALHRVDAAADRDRAASDRALAAEDRVLAATDRAQAAAEREADEVDALTGARRRAPGLTDVQHEIDRANRGDGRLIAVYVDVDGLKATNDSKGHHAGDMRLKHIVAVLQTQLRSYDPVVRLGGDEFVCTVSETAIESVQERFARITAQLSLTPDDGSITVGFAQLAPGDSPMNLIDRADRHLIATRDTRNQDQRGAAPKSADNEKETGNADSDNDPQSATEKRKMKDALDDFLRPN
jgi:diguanylate cyclase (GGDEF)-like protein